MCSSPPDPNEPLGELSSDGGEGFVDPGAGSAQSAPAAPGRQPLLPVGLDRAQAAGVADRVSRQAARGAHSFGAGPDTPVFEHPPPSETALSPGMQVRAECGRSRASAPEVESTPAPPWVIAVGRVFRASCRRASILHDSAPLKVMHDCAGINGPEMAWVWLQAHGVLRDMPSVVAAAEKDERAREWMLRHHRWPKRLFPDVTERSWNEAFDMIQQESQP